LRVEFTAVSTTSRHRYKLNLMTASMGDLKNHAKDLVREQRAFLDDLVGVRKAAGLSQQQVAERMGVSQSAVSLFEHYDANPTLSSIRRYALAVGADLAMGVKPREGKQVEAS